MIELSITYLKGHTHPQLSATKHPDHPPSETTLIQLKPNPTKTPIVAIDVSSIRLGETQTGTLLAVRGAIVWRQASRYRYLRLGPFPFHITEKNQREVFNLFRTPQKAIYRQEFMLDILHVQTKLTTLLERWIQASVNQTTSDSLILWDGSLTAGTPETPTQAMEHTLKEARENQNTILAFSKMTRLLFDGQRITDLVWKHLPPCLLRGENHPIHVGSLKSLGNVYVARLSGGSCAFRLDVDKELSQAEAVDAVQKLIGNDTVQQSYPETLRLAHIYSTFTANEVLGMQRCIAKESNLKIVTRPNVRRLLFGCFGKGPEG